MNRNPIYKDFVFGSKEYWKEVRRQHWLRHGDKVTQEKRILRVNMTPEQIEIYRAYNRKSSKKTRYKNTNFINEYKKENGCFLCPEKEPCCLDFHHKDPTTKNFCIANGIAGYSIESLKKEMSLCILLCANCHRKVHHGKLSIHES